MQLEQNWRVTLSGVIKSCFRLRSLFISSNQADTLMNTNYMNSHIESWIEIPNICRSYASIECHAPGLYTLQSWVFLFIFYAFIFSALQRFLRRAFVRGCWRQNLCARKAQRQRLTCYHWIDLAESTSLPLRSRGQQRCRNFFDVYVQQLPAVCLPKRWRHSLRSNHSAHCLELGGA